jgi:PII-like signaling protein
MMFVLNLIGTVSLCLLAIYLGKLIIFGMGMKWKKSQMPFYWEYLSANPTNTKVSHYQNIWSVFFKQEGLVRSTALRGISVFGKTSKSHTASILRLPDDLLTLIEVVDRKEKYWTSENQAQRNDWRRINHRRRD